MNRMNWLSVFLYICFIPMALAMRCGQKLVYEGDNKATVLSKCGEPLDKQIHQETKPLFNAAGYQIGISSKITEQWVYQRSSADFQYTLIFDSGILKEINANRS